MTNTQFEGDYWLDGEYITANDCNVHILTHSLHYGVGVFEGVRAYLTDEGPSIFRLHDHTKRLFNSAKILNMEIPYSQDELNQVQKEVLKHNKLDVAYIRPLVFYGNEGLGLHAHNLTTHVLVATWRWGAYLGSDALSKGVKIMVSSLRRNNVNSNMCKAKACGNYVNAVLALSEANARGFDEALMLDQEGFVAEGSGENIFIVRDGKLFTPDNANILEGITRETIMTLAQDLGLSVETRRITRDELYIADEAFFTGTAAEVTPIAEIDNRPIGSGMRGPITEKLQQAYFDVVKGKNTQHKEWINLI